MRKKDVFAVCRCEREREFESEAVDVSRDANAAIKTRRWRVGERCRVVCGEVWMVVVWCSVQGETTKREGLGDQGRRGA